jgi:hypothetical protein
MAIHVLLVALSLRDDVVLAQILFRNLDRAMGKNYRRNYG